MFAVIRHYHFDKKDSAEIDRLIEEQFVPIIRKAKGFDRYYWLDTGNGEGASFGVFKDKDGADESVALAAEFVRTHMAQLLRQKPEVIEGSIKAHRLIDDSTAMSRNTPSWRFPSAAEKVSDSVHRSCSPP